MGSDGSYSMMKSKHISGIVLLLSPVAIALYAIAADLIHGVAPPAGPFSVFLFYAMLGVSGLCCLLSLAFLCLRRISVFAVSFLVSLLALWRVLMLVT